MSTTQIQDKYDFDTLSITLEVAKEMQQIKEIAIINDTFMKAPNGKPTKLNERQWVQVRTATFKDWFGDWKDDPANASKVVDENGEPMVVYHGTKDVFTKFSTSKTATPQFWFTNRKDLIESGEVGATGKGIIMPVFLNIKNPSSWQEEDSLTNGQIKGRGFDGKDLTDDGEGTFVAFMPNQIKSAINNIGLFNSEDTNILNEPEMEYQSKHTNTMKANLTSTQEKKWDFLWKNLMPLSYDVASNKQKKAFEDVFNETFEKYSKNLLSWLQDKDNLSPIQKEFRELAVARGAIIPNKMATPGGEGEWKNDIFQCTYLEPQSDERNNRGVWVYGAVPEKYEKGLSDLLQGFMKGRRGSIQEYSDTEGLHEIECLADGLSVKDAKALMGDTKIMFQHLTLEDFKQNQEIKIEKKNTEMNKKLTAEQKAEFIHNLESTIREYFELDSNVDDVLYAAEINEQLKDASPIIHNNFSEKVSAEIEGVLKKYYSEYLDPPSKTGLSKVEEEDKRENMISACAKEIINYSNKLDERMHNATVQKQAVQAYVNEAMKDAGTSLTGKTLRDFNKNITAATDSIMKAFDLPKEKRERVVDEMWGVLAHYQPDLSKMNYRAVDAIVDRIKDNIGQLADDTDLNPTLKQKYGTLSEVENVVKDYFCYDTTIIEVMDILGALKQDAEKVQIISDSYATEYRLTDKSNTMSDEGKQEAFKTLIEECAKKLCATISNYEKQSLAEMSVEADQKQKEDIKDMLIGLSETEFERICTNPKTQASVLETIYEIRNSSHTTNLLLLENPSTPQNTIHKILLNKVDNMGVSDGDAKTAMIAALKNFEAKNITSDNIDIIVNRCASPNGMGSAYFEDEMYLIARLPQTTGEALSKLEKCVTADESLESIIRNENVFGKTLLSIMESDPGFTQDILKSPNFEKVKDELTTTPKNILKLAGQKERDKFFEGKKIKIESFDDVVILHKGKIAPYATVQLTATGIKAEYANIDKPKMQIKAAPKTKQKTSSKKSIKIS
jgi:hypothetical protein